MAARRIYGVIYVLLMLYLLPERPLQAIKIVHECLRPRRTYLSLQGGERLMNLSIADPPTLFCFPKWRCKVKSRVLARQRHCLDDRDMVQHRYQSPGIRFTRRS